MQTGAGGISHQCQRPHKLLTIVTKFPVLLKLSVLKNYISFVPKITNQLRLLQTMNLK